MGEGETPNTTGSLASRVDRLLVGFRPIWEGRSPEKSRKVVRFENACHQPFRPSRADAVEQARNLGLLDE